MTSINAYFFREVYIKSIAMRLCLSRFLSSLLLLKFVNSSSLRGELKIKEQSDSISGSKNETTGITRNLQSKATDSIFDVVVDNDRPDPLLSALTQNEIPANAATTGIWSSRLYDWPIVGIHLMMLPDGRVLSYGTATGGNPLHDGRTLVFWDPKEGIDNPAAFTDTPNAPGVDSFCSSATIMPNGKAVISGGEGIGSPGGTSLETTILDLVEDKGVPTRGADLNHPRWYGTMTRLADGRPLMTGGAEPYMTLGWLDTIGQASAVSSTPEVFDEKSGRWHRLTGAYSLDAFGAESNRYWYPRQWVTRTGSVFGISTDKMWEMTTTGNGSIKTLGNFKTRPNERTKPNTGPTNTAVMYDTDKILQVGGNGYANGAPSHSSAEATIVDIHNIAEGRVRIIETNPMNFPRQWANSNVLPDGKVLVTGGTKFADSAGENDVRSAEIWDPTTGQWTIGAPAGTYRGYHSSTALLHNGIVLAAGGGSPGPVLNFNAQLYYPPYLFKQDGGRSVLAARPKIISLSTDTPGYATKIDVQVEAGMENSIKEVSFIALSAVTHSFDSNQRRMKLAFRAVSSGKILVYTPGSANLAPPGYYQLSIVDNEGVPSVAVTISLDAFTVVHRPRSLVDTERLHAFDYPKLFIQHKPSPQTNQERVIIGRVNSAVAQKAANLKLVPCLAGSYSCGTDQCISIESGNQPGYYFRHSAFFLHLHEYQDNPLFKVDASFCMREGNAGEGSISFESVNYPRFFIRHVGFRLRMSIKQGNDALFAKHTSFFRDNVVARFQSVNLDTFWFSHKQFEGVIRDHKGASAADQKKASFRVHRCLLGQNACGTASSTANTMVKENEEGENQCISLESVSNPGYYVRHSAFRIHLEQNNGSDEFRGDASFCIRTGLSSIYPRFAGSISLESASYPGYYVRHQGFVVYLQKETPDILFKLDASFRRFTKR
mmetsp:Transcript_8238/g.11889  ORF Transcript_8238/g.11889 Transcript_8238/m.11889 type:complete len:942 (+) Transcript_8238:66-2891(+)